MTRCGKCDRPVAAGRLIGVRETSTHPDKRPAADRPFRRLPIAGGGPRTGAPVRSALVAGLFAVAQAGWLAATVTLLFAAGDLASARPFAGPVVLAVHLVTVVVLPSAVTGAALHLLPVMLRNSLSWQPMLAALPALLAGGFLVASGVGLGSGWLTWPGVLLVAAGLGVVLLQLIGLLVRAPRGRMVVVSRTGVGLVCLHVTAALAVGAVIFARGDQSLAGISHERLVLIHLHLAVIGWLALLIVTVGRTLIPMLAQAPAAARRTLPVEELCLSIGLWVLIAGLALSITWLEVLGGGLIVLALGRFAALVARVARARRSPSLEAPLGHVLAGVVFIAQAAGIGLALLAGSVATRNGAEAYVILLLLGWAVGVTLGHTGKLLSLSVWVSWPPGPRPKQADLYPRRLWQAETAFFALGVEGLAAGALLGSQSLALAAAVLLFASALTATMGTAHTWRLRSR
jgi:hypothetical protein